jgi:hypothetical protein
MMAMSAQLNKATPALGDSHSSVIMYMISGFFIVTGPLNPMKANISMSVLGMSMGHG